MTPEQRAKIQALRNGIEYRPPVEPVRQIPTSIKMIEQKINFRKLFEERKR